MQIFVDPKDAKNMSAELKEKVREDEQNKGNLLQRTIQLESDLK